MKSIIERLQPSRMAALARISLADDWRPFLLSGVIIGCLVLFAGILMNVMIIRFAFYMMLLMGIVQVSKTFADAHQQEKGVYYFTLPASVEEKYLVKLAATLLGFYLYTVVVSFAAYTLVNLLRSALHSGELFQLVNPFEWNLTDSFKFFVFLHSVFFFGSIIFKRNSFFKTLLFLVLALFLSMFAAGKAAQNIYFQRGAADFFFQFDGSGEMGRGFGTSIGEFAEYVKLIFYLVIPIILYALTYLKFKKSEIKG